MKPTGLVQLDVSSLSVRGVSVLTIFTLIENIFFDIMSTDNSIVGHNDFCLGNENNNNYRYGKIQEKNIVTYPEFENRGLPVALPKRSTIFV